MSLAAHVGRAALLLTTWPGHWHPVGRQSGRDPASALLHIL